MFNKLTQRRRQLLYRLIKRTKINKDLFLYFTNRLLWLRHNKEVDTCIPHPTNAMIELGNVCNLHCNICPREYAYGKKMDIGFMPLDKVLSILNQMIPYLDSVGLTGLGETMMYPHLLEVLQYIKSRKPSVVTTVSTNAHFPGYRQRIEPLLPYLDNIQFSVDGVDDVYERMRPGTNFQEIRKNIISTISLSKQTEFMINFVVSQDNYEDMSNVIRFAVEIGIKYIHFNIMSITSMPDKTKDYYSFINTPQFLNAISSANEEAARHPELEVTGIIKRNNKPSDTIGFRKCNAMWEYPYITWNGYYVPCCGKPFPKELNFGNVFEDGVMEVLNSKKAQAFRKMWQKNETHNFCSNCI